MSEISDLVKKFVFTEVLKSDPQTKSIVLLGTINDQDAIITLERSPFIADTTFDVQSAIQELQLINHNDVYFWSSVITRQDLTSAPGAKLNLIYPATETHIRKYAKQVFHYILESPEVYAEHVVPYVNSMKGDRIKWVYNILFEGKESESFVYHDTDKHSGFVLLPDMKWDKISMDALYLCTIVNRTDISSIRDLRGVDVPFLQETQRKIKKITSEKYPVNADELRVFVHYQPSYYHFHIHVVNVKHPGLGDSIAAGKAILLDDIIGNLILVPDYYAKKSIGYLLGENHGLWQVDGFRKAHYSRLEAELN